ncbi:MAG: hypothetical protein OXQ89_13580 [Rhodospirillaceae bacterium]|nr:hypothetical protein [Rhodospirillaceae bacterium]MDD9998766.1 hypothetical protein [Rhodospirillaceae bacterium]
MSTTTPKLGLQEDLIEERKKREELEKQKRKDSPKDNTSLGISSDKEDD